MDLTSRGIFAHEALVRGPAGEGAGSVMAEVNADNRYAFDQKCRVVAIETAARIGLSGRISINFLPNAVYRPAPGSQTTLWTADKCDFPLENIIFEFTEGEAVSDLGHLRAIFDEYRSHGFSTAIDDFGAGHSGLSRLADLRPDLVKLDMSLVRDIDSDPRRRTIVAGMARIAAELGIAVVAEGIETEDELRCLQDCGIQLVQGYLIARPSLEAVASVDRIALPRRAA